MLGFTAHSVTVSARYTLYFPREDCKKNNTFGSGLAPLAHTFGPGLVSIWLSFALDYAKLLPTAQPKSSFDNFGLRSWHVTWAVTSTAGHCQDLMTAVNHISTTVSYTSRHPVMFQKPSSGA
jgi:hypothetical protein